MGFITYEFPVFFAAFFVLYWVGKSKNWRNLALLAGSLYFTAGWFHGMLRFFSFPRCLTIF